MLALCRHVKRECKGHGKLFILLVAAVGALAAACIPFDHPFHEHIKATRTESMLVLAGQLRSWGRGVDGLFFIVVTLAGAKLARRPDWRPALLAAVMATLVAAAVVNPIRIATGRPRPRAERADGFTGPTSSYRMQSFPSGHCAASFAAASALVVGVPCVGWPALASAGGVAWASLYSRNHYLTDVVLGGGLGLVIGLIFGRAARAGGKALGENAQPDP